MPVAAPLIGAAGTIGGSLLASSATKSAANKAANAQVAAAQLGIDEQRRQFDATQANLSPFRTFGTSALGPLGDLLGLNGNDAAGAAITGLKDSPLYKALFANGEQTILQNASATGGLRGGNTQASLANFGRDTLASVIESQLARLTGAAGMGENAAAQTGTFGAGAADAITKLLGEQGAARSGAALAGGAASAASANNIAAALAGLANNSSIQNALFPSSGNDLVVKAAQKII